MLPKPSPSENLELVGGRYRVEERLARGGMGSVFRAFDTVRGKHVALKRLTANTDAQRRTRMFEREYHTLVSLKHPRIIEVYDYGVDTEGAYYTMELLDGRDLRELAPLPYQVACRYLRDVASSLALLHARNLVHRDLSARNVRITSDGRAKLIDFGALTSFGKSDTVVGTPPGMPPESVYGGVLDQRADIYGLGALAYWVLSKHHAYDVRTMEELPEAWQKTPRPPSERLRGQANGPAIPAELDELVMAMLSANPLARPATAAEVIARLSTIGGLAPDDEPLSAMSYLRGGATVGRERERAHLRERMERALSGGDSLVLIEGNAGMGSGRILSELAIEARMSGTTAVVIDAGLHQGLYSVAEQITRTLLDARPDKARAALVGHEAALARFTAGGSDRISTRRMSAMPERKALDPRENRLRTQGALLEWIDALVREVPVSIAVHNFQQADDGSATFLAALARGVSNARLFIALAYDPDDLANAPSALAQLRKDNAPTRLRGLTVDDVRKLVDSTFGEVQNTERLASWLHSLTGGSPADCLDIMEHLIDRGVIRFVDGAWSLPHEVSAEELPGSLNQVSDARVERLGEQALRLCSALSVHRGSVPRERCFQIAALEGIAEPLKALDELARQGVVAWGDERFRFVHAGVRAAVLRRLGADEVRRLHAQLGGLLAREGGDDDEDLEATLDAGWHLLHGGEERRGADLLADVGVKVSFDTEGIPAAIPALRAALDAFRTQRRSIHDLARLLGPLAVSGLYTDRKILETYGAEAVETLEVVLGLSLARRLRPWLGRQLSTRIGTAYGVWSTMLRYGPRKTISTYIDFMTAFHGATLGMATLGTVTQNVESSRSYADRLEPLAIFGARSAPGLTYDLANAFALLTADRLRESLASFKSVLDRLDEPKPILGMPAPSFRGMQSLTMYGYGALLSLSEDPTCLKIAERLDKVGLRLYAMFADQVRSSYHGVRGEIALARHYRERVELFAVQAGSSWQAELWAPSAEMLTFHLSRDVVGLKNVASQLARLSREIPSLSVHADLAQAAYLMVQGEYAASHAVGVSHATNSVPRSFIGWAPLKAGEIENLAELGRADEARRVGLEVMARYSEDDLKVTPMVVPVVIALALAEAKLGDLQGAAERIDRFLAGIGGGGGPLTVGSLHEARAKIAIMAEDTPTARLHAVRMAECFNPTENPVLIARSERLQRGLDSGSLRPERTSDTIDLGPPKPSQTITLLRACEPGKKRFELALQLLVEQTGGTSGCVFTYDEGGLTLVALRGMSEPDAALREQLLNEVTTYLDGAEKTPSQSTLGSEDEDAMTRVANRRKQRAYVLGLQRDGDSHVVGVAWIAGGNQRIREAPSSHVAALTEGLLDPSDRITAPTRDA